MRIVLALILVVATYGAALAIPTVFVSPAEVVVNAGQSFEMSIRVDAGYPDSVTAFLVDFAFDSEVVELVDAEEGSLFANCGYPTMYHWDIEGPGMHSCNDVTLGHASHVIPPGELVALDFVALAVGETPVAITAVDLRDINRDPIVPVYSADGFVIVVPETGIDEPAEPVEPEQLVRLAPNPSPGPVEIEFSVNGLAEAPAIAVHDVAGRVVARPDAVSLEGGVGVVTWDGRTDLGDALPSGVYFIVVRTAEAERRARCVLLR